ncbi:IclR family transcriptional regulator [Chloroflexota bacterium]
MEVKKGGNMTKIQTIKRAFKILNLYSMDTPELGVKEVSQKLYLNKSTVRGLVSSLESVGMLQKAEGKRKYRLGRKVIMFAQAFFSNIDLRAVVLPHIEEVHKKTSEEVAIYVIDGDRRILFEYIESTHPVRHVVDLGSHYGPLHAGAQGKLLLAHMPDKKIDEIIKRMGLPRYTSNTITDRKRLQREIEKIRNDGFAVSRGERVDALCSVSAPVRDYKGNVIAAMTITRLTMNYTPELTREYTKLAKEEARKISQELGYQE